MLSSRVILVASPVRTPNSNTQINRSGQIIRSIQAELDALWFGWSDSVFSSNNIVPPTEGAHGVTLESTEKEVLVERVNTAMLWPTFYGRADLIDFSAAAYDLYQTANTRLATEVAKSITNETVVWVHDYLHLPLGQALRRTGSMVPIGFLFHAPFPSPDQFVSMPRHEELLRQLCAYDVLSFQSEACRRHFEMAAHRCINAQPMADGLASPSGHPQIRVDELPGRCREIAAMSPSSFQREAAGHLRAGTGASHLIGSCASLDHAQGILERFQSFEMALDRFPELRSKVSLVHACLPQRPWLTEDTQLRGEVERASSRINGKFSTLEWNPIHYFHDPPDDVHLLALYRESAIALITPFYEGVSLTAKDFVAAQAPDDPGVLILSKLISSASSYEGALFVNPHDKDELMQAMRHALAMPRVERHIRWRKLIDRFEEESLTEFCDRFINALKTSIVGPRQNAG